MIQKKFDICDRVICSKSSTGYSANSNLHYGMRGTVCHYIMDTIEDTTKYTVGVRFDVYVSGHSCNNHCEYGYGWYVEECDLELDVDDEMHSDESDLNAFIISIQE